MAEASKGGEVEALPTDEGGCVTKRFVIFNEPGWIPMKKGGWLKDEHLIDFLRQVMLHDGWRPGFQATVLELTWDNDLWASTAAEYLALYEDAVGREQAVAEWTKAREKHERIYKAPPSMDIGTEIEEFRRRTALPAQEKRTSGDLSLSALRAANVERQAAWCPDPSQQPDLGYRGNELAGETGEACNVIKKLERERHGWAGSRDTLGHLAEELADVVICADLCAITAGVDLASAVVAKFNATSAKVGLSQRLAMQSAPVRE
nr:MazG-like family protein [uncultured Brevundimonas sp.]